MATPPAIRFELTRDPEQFAAATMPFLSERIECNVMVTVLMNVLDGVLGDPPPLFCDARDDHDRICFAAFRTPPWFMLPSELDERGADALLELWLPQDPELPGVNGKPGTARAIAAAWSRRTGRPTHCRMREAMNALHEVTNPPRPARGELRPAHEDDRALLVEWMIAFAVEANVVGARPEALVDGRLKRGGMLLWDDDGPVSMLGVAPQVAGTVRIGPVYTPPQFRRRGYAGSAVAAASRRALAQGAQTCMLFTDLANPTSNKIYGEVGYERCGDWEEYAFS